MEARGLFVRALGLMLSSPLLTSLLWVGGGATATVATTRLLRHRARRGRIARRLAELDVSMPLETRHLTPGLASLTRQARTLRLVLATPLQRMPDRPWQETPWRRRQRCDEYDRALADARRALWDWLSAGSRLPAGDRAVLHRLGIELGAVRSALFAPGVLERTPDAFDDVWLPNEPDFDAVTDGLFGAMHDLHRLEYRLLSMRSDPYR